MRRLLFVAVSILLMFVGILSIPLLRFYPPPHVILWLLPPTLLTVTVLTLLRLTGWRYALTSLTLSVLATFALTYWGWPTFRPLTPDTRQRRNPPPGLHQIVLQVPPRYKSGVFSEPLVLNVPLGASISVFAADLEAPRFMALSPRGEILVSEPRAGRIRLLKDADRDGVAESLITFAEGLRQPHGLVFSGDDLFVAETGRLSMLRDSDADGHSDLRRTISTDIPGRGGHWTRSIALGPLGDLFVSAGSSCNVCIEEDTRRAAILRFPPGSPRAEIYATGLRNSVGLAFHPRTAELWASDNGRDLLGDDLPPEEINLIIQGGDFGWPYCYGARVPDPDYGSQKRCSDTVLPQVQMQAHSAPLGIAFGSGLDFPSNFRDMLYVAFHGSWNRSVPTGYKLVGIPFSGGRPSKPPIDIVTGWLTGHTAWGRPVAPLVGADGALYISDDRAGAIYRLWFEDDVEPEKP